MMFRNIGIRGQMILLTLLPTLTVSILLGFYFISMRFSDLNKNLYMRGEALATELVISAEYGLKSKDKVTLQSITDELISYPDVKMAAIYDENGSLITFSGRVPQVSMSFFEDNSKVDRKKIFVLEGDNEIEFLAPVISTVTSDSMSTFGENKRIGWIVANLSYDSTLLNEYQTVVATILIVLIGLTVSILFGLRLGGNIINPLFLIISAVRRIKEGHLDTKVYAKPLGEMQVLEDGINKMSFSLLNSHEEMKKNIRKATKDLRTTLKTIEKQNIQLDQARQSAIEASKIKSKFLANMSHEIRTPMNGIIGFLELLQKSNLSDIQKDYVDTITQSSNNLLNIINDILDFSKLEACVLVLESQPFNLMKLIEDSTILFKPTIVRKNVDFSLILAPDLPQIVVGDSLRFSQILTNLIGNALKFTDVGGVIVKANFEKIGINKVKLIFEVSDTGIGLSKKQTEILFNAFTQADVSTSRKYGGTGLGLTITKSLVEKMEGAITVRSKVNQGSVFSFYVVLECNQFTPYNFKSLRRKNAIILDQTLSANEGLCNTFFNMGYSFHVVKKESSLIDYIIEHDDIDIIVLSYSKLPDIDDLNFSLIMDLKSFSNADIYLFSNHTGVILSNYIDQLGISGTITFPYRIENIISLLEKQKNYNNDSKKFPLVAASNKLDKKYFKHIVLAVDDNMINLKLLRVFLENVGLDAYTTTSGNEALKLAEQYKFKLILTDVHMPEIDGIELCKRLRMIQYYKNIPIIAVTADNLESNNSLLLSSGFDYVQVKPVDESAIRAIVEYFLEKKRSQDTLENYKTSENVFYSETKKDTSLPLIDLKIGKKLAGNNINFAKEMMHKFMKDLPGEQKKIEDAFKKRNYIVMKDYVHRLNGGSSYCGVPGIKKAISELEMSLNKYCSVSHQNVIDSYNFFKVISKKTLIAYKKIDFNID